MLKEGAPALVGRSEEISAALVVRVPGRVDTARTRQARTAEFRLRLQGHSRKIAGQANTNSEGQRSTGATRCTAVRNTLGQQLVRLDGLTCTCSRQSERLT